MSRGTVCLAYLHGLSTSVNNISVRIMRPTFHFFMNPDTSHQSAEPSLIHGPSAHISPTITNPRLHVPEYNIQIVGHQSFHRSICNPNHRINQREVAYKRGVADSTSHNSRRLRQNTSCEQNSGKLLMRNPYRWCSLGPLLAYSRFSCPNCCTVTIRFYQ